METGNPPTITSRIARRTAFTMAVCAIAAGSFLLGRNMDKPGACVCQGSDCIVAYYFHRTGRCPTCQRIEALAQETLESAFAAQLKDGRLQWQTVDYEAADNVRYRDEYKIQGPCLVLARLRSGKPVEWRSLPEVWEYVGDRRAFVKFVQGNVREFLDYIQIPGNCCT